MYAERAYFDNDACAHCAARDEHNRLRAIAKRNASLIQQVERRRGSRARAA